MITILCLAETNFYIHDIPDTTNQDWTSRGFVIENIAQGLFDGPGEELGDCPEVDQHFAHCADEHRVLLDTGDHPFVPEQDLETGYAAVTFQHVIQ